MKGQDGDLPLSDVSDVGAFCEIVCENDGSRWEGGRVAPP